MSDTYHADDVAGYISEYSEEERHELCVAEFALDISLLLQKARQDRDLSQSAVAKLLDLTQQSVSRIESPGSNVTLSTLSKYLSALGYNMQLIVTEADSGAEVGRAQVRAEVKSERVTSEEALSRT